MKETWKLIDFKPNYSVSNMGRIRNNKSNRILKPWKINSYLKVKIGGKKILVHRLVAYAFIPNPENLPVVNHINGVGSDNNLTNLEWTTYKGNTFHSKNVTKNGLHISYKKISSIFENNEHLSNIELINLLLINCR